MTTTHTLGYPRIGDGRDLKWALESYWQGKVDLTALKQTALAVRERNLADHISAGIDRPATGDFSLYDHVADTALLFGLVPERFGLLDNSPDALFALARGVKNDSADADSAETCCSGTCGASTAPEGQIAPLAMKKWFNSNYHYLVPELTADQSVNLQPERYLEQVREALVRHRNAKPVLLGPLSFLWLSRGLDESGRLARLPDLLPAYRSLLAQIADLGVEWVQIDEPILTLDLPPDWLQAFEPAYHGLKVPGIRLLLTTYFGDLNGNVSRVAALPVDGVHVDAVATTDLVAVADRLPDYKILSVGIVDGRSIWRTDLAEALDRLEPLHARLGERLWLAPSCSLLHVPLDAAGEDRLDPVLRANLSFARQKLDELSLLATALDKGREAIADQISASTSAREALAQHPGRINPGVRQAVDRMRGRSADRESPFAVRARAQQARYRLPVLPTTTIGSFPQTADIRSVRRDHRRGELTDAQYRERMKQEIATVIEAQERIGLDVLVHGEPERNDMVEYFGEQLDGFAFTAQGWVQSYGSRCVKPPIIWGDVARPQPMTVSWIRYAQSLTDRPVKGMLTGPVTLLFWSFVRDDLSREQVAYQLAAALAEEVADLIGAGIGIIQVDEPAFREGLPLRRAAWQGYLDWAVRAFKYAVADAPADVQIHTHMCYSEFNDIIESIAALDADVITIETARSNMELLDAFAEFDYPNAIGPGLYDIHAPLLPTETEIADRLRLALDRVPVERLWVNPDCGLKTRRWNETTPALNALVAAARRVRETLAQPA